jgi:hypothetical protein|tara:strand:- start:6887 stop:7630 length:744 start_codon:yes stop_codon:yes gene_type:complete
MSSRKKTYDDLFNDLNKYMLTSENIIRHSNIKQTFNIDKKSLNKSKFENKSKIANKQPEIFYPRQHDSLFWCFYIIYMGEDWYQQNINHIFRTEKDMKIRTIEILAEKKELLKENKLKRIEVENELLNEKKITVKGLKALCLAYGVSVCMVKERVFYDFDFNVGGERGVIIHGDNIGVYNEDVPSYYEKIVSSYYQITNATKPINAISGYTVSDLQNICKKLNLTIINSTGTKLNKKDLYQSIQSQL